jgi:hypothetical protein
MGCTYFAFIFSHFTFQQFINQIYAETLLISKPVSESLTTTTNQQPPTVPTTTTTTNHPSSSKGMVLVLLL